MGLSFDTYRNCGLCFWNTCQSCPQHTQTHTTFRFPFCLFFPEDFRSWSGLVALLSLCCPWILKMVDQDFPLYVTPLSIAWLISTNSCFCRVSSLHVWVTFAIISFALCGIVLCWGGGGTTLYLACTNTVKNKYKHTKYRDTIQKICSCVCVCVCVCVCMYVCKHTK